jgi:hypothetical protein
MRRSVLGAVMRRSVLGAVMRRALQVVRSLVRPIAAARSRRMPWTGTMLAARAEVARAEVARAEVARTMRPRAMLAGASSVEVTATGRRRSFGTTIARTVVLGPGAVMLGARSVVVAALFARTVVMRTIRSVLSLRGARADKRQGDARRRPARRFAEE